MTFPIYIPSKGRPNSSTARLLKEHGIPYYLVIEPQDEQAYREKRTGVLKILDENNKGIAYVRNAILKMNSGDNWFWMIDDDISRFMEVRNNRCYTQQPREVLEKAERIIISDTDVAIGALDYQQFAWAAKREYTDNSYAEVAVLMNPSRISHQYDDYVALKEDRDFAMQVIKSGFKTRRVHGYAFSAPRNASNQGGLNEEYKAGKEKIAVARMIEKWGNKTCNINKKKSGRTDVKINWRKIKGRTII
jgi:glycosyltransferase involved in cell wall biosynthesis